MDREENAETEVEETVTDDQAIDSKGFLQSVIDGIQDSITIVDRDYKILFANKTARSRVHSSSNREKIVGQTCFRTFHARNVPCQHCLTPVTFEKGTIGTTTYTKTGPDGQDRFLELHTYPIKGADGRVERVIEINRDITERKHLEMQLIQASKMAALGELAGGLAHQLNNPLVGVQNFVQLLLARMEENDPNRKLAETIERAGGECVKIIRNLLKFSRDSHHDFTSVEINPVINDVLSLLEKQINLEGVKIEKSLADDIPPFQGNETQLAQVIMNIIQNGAQAIEGSGTIQIRSRLSADGGEAVIEISDTGAGIPKIHRERIFEPFFTSKEEGTGLGLSVAYGIVKNHHGSIHVDSEENRGTTFTLRFPLRPEAGNRQEDQNE